MCTFMRRSSIVSLKISMNFYFRRLKRLIPVYLLVITVVLFVSTLITDPYYYSILSMDGLLASTFLSNMPTMHRITYAHGMGKSIVFLNTWSLSAEMQFYSVVPPIFAFNNWVVCKFGKRIGPKLANHLLILIMILMMFGLQVYCDSVQARYMLFSLRLWQFFVGFLAHDLRQHLIEVDITKKWTILGNPKFQRSIQDGTLVLLMLFGLSDTLPGDNDQPLRFIVSTLTFGLIVISNLESTTKGCLSSRFGVWLGDISYGLYLTHWPLLIAHQHILYSIYKPYLSISVGIPLIASFLLVAYVLDKVDKLLNRRIHNWSNLCKFMSIFYLAIFANLTYLKLNERHDEEVKLTENEANKWLDIIWSNRQKSTTSTELLDYNVKLLAITEQLKCPQVKNHPFFANWTVNTNEEGFHQFKGNGTKTIILFGNSHAEYAMSGIARVFHDLYDEFTTILVHGCAPVTAEMQPSWSRTGYKLKCQQFIENFPQTLARWSTPADIVILLFGYADGSPNPPIDNIESDQNFQFMQQFYRNVSSYTREVLIYSTMNPVFHKSPRQTIEQWERGNLDVELPEELLKEQLEYKLSIRQRIDAVQCSPCIKYDPLKLWCSQHDGKLCTSYDTQNGLIDFVDEQHISAYASIKNAQQIRKLYEEEYLQ